MRRTLAIAVAALLALAVMLALRAGRGEDDGGARRSEEPARVPERERAADTPARAAPPAEATAPPAGGAGTRPKETPGLVEVTEDGPSRGGKGVLPDYDKARRGVLNIMESSLRRAKDLAFLRGGGVERIDPEVVEAAISLAENSQDPEARATACRALHGVKFTGAVEALLRRLRSDVDGAVREAAARSLGEALDAEGVRASLEHAAMHDAEERVRVNAAQAANSGGK